MIRALALAILSLSMAAGAASAGQRLPAPRPGTWWGTVKAAPEIDPGMLMSGLTLLLGGVTVLTTRRR